jgi:hypothetical protein
MRRGVKTGLLVLVALAGRGSLARADFAAIVDPGAITWTDSGAGLSIGWRFFVDQPITITGLGLYDAGDDGLASAHVMGIWRVKKAGGLRLERWVNISGNGDLKIDHHVYEALAEPFTIVPDPVPYVFNGVDYYERWLVGAWSPSNSTDSLILQPQTAATFPIVQAGIITFQSYTYKPWTSYPDTTLGDVLSASNSWVPWGSTSGSDYFGVNFQYTAVPMPSAAVLGVIGLGYAGWRCRRRTA